VQPVYVEDVGEAIARVLAERGSAGQTYEPAGPGAYTLRELGIRAKAIEDIVPSYIGRIDHG
jgi:uncharacterized protein YbjT (DUF2867 family)